MLPTIHVTKARNESPLLLGGVFVPRRTDSPENTAALSNSLRLGLLRASGLLCEHDVYSRSMFGKLVLVALNIIIQWSIVVFTLAVLRWCCAGAAPAQQVRPRLLRGQASPAPVRLHPERAQL